VPGKPASHRACDLASVMVMTALTSAAGLRRRLSTATMFTVPPKPAAPAGAASLLPVSGCPAPAAPVPAAPASAAPVSAAAQVGWLIPTVAAATTPSSRPVLSRRTSTAVSMPIPGPSRPRPRASSARWAAGSGRL
jgi:hypothetical protein